MSLTKILYPGNYLPDLAKIAFWVGTSAASSVLLFGLTHGPTRKDNLDWRDIAVSHETSFIPYRNSIFIKESDSTYYKTFMDFNKIENDSNVIELLKYWSQGNMVFYEGINILKTIYNDILNRIECIELNNCK